MARDDDVPCFECDGSGFDGDRICWLCNGQGDIAFEQWEDLEKQIRRAHPEEFQPRSVTIFSTLLNEPQQRRYFTVG